MLYFVVGFLIFSFVFTGINDFIREQDRAAKERERAELIETEKGRDYYISFNNLDYLDENPVIEINCELSPAREASESEKYPGESQPLICQESEEITGVFSKYDSTELKIDYLETSADIDYDKFKFILKGLTFNKYSWETDEANFDELKNVGKEQPLILSIKNNILDEETLHKAIKIRYIFSDNDIAQLKSRHLAYKDYKAKEEERIAKEEAEKKAAEAAAAAAAARAEQEKQQQQSAPKSTTNTKPSQPASKPAAQPSQPAPKPATPSQPTTPTENPNLPLKAICKDGSVSYQDDVSKPNYRGMCSNHGGIKTRLGRIP